MAIKDILSLKCGFINIQSVGNKTMEIRELITEIKFDILSLAETWLSELDSAKITEMTPSTHSFLHIPRQGRGGGVGLFLSNSFSEIKIVNHPRAISFEHIEVNFKFKGNCFSFIVVYRPPASNANVFFDEFENLLDSIDLLAKKVIICGDFNFWMDDNTISNTKIFNEKLAINQLINNTNTVTTSTGHMLDLVISDSINKSISDVTVEEKRRFTSIHHLISFHIPLLKEKQRKRILFRNKLDFNQTEYITAITEKFNTLLLSQCSHTERCVRKSDCVDCLMDLYTQINKSEYDARCPEVEKSIVIVDKSPWFNGETLRAKQEKRRKEHAWLRNKTENAWTVYCEARNSYNNLIRRTKIEYYKKKINEAAKDVRKLYCLLNGLMGYSERRLPDCRSEQDLADDFLLFFKNKIDNISDSFPLNLECPVETEHVCSERLSSFQTIEDTHVINIISRVKKTNCPSDPVPIKDIVNADNFSSLISVFVKIINTSITTKRFPSSEKLAIIKPVLKTGLDPQSLSSYRPVSNLSFMSKMIENVILDQLMAHLLRTNALPDSQSAYRKFYSTETTICSVISDLLTVIDEGKCAILILLDLSAAFDTVVHHLLIEDLRSVGIEADALDYLTDYLNNRRYCVKIGKSTSESMPLSRGVPQGSVLGPILFCIYTIGLSKLLENTGVMFKTFADDTQLYLTITDIDATCERLNIVLGKLKTWMMYKQLKLNVNKTEYMVIGKKNGLDALRESQFVVDNCTLEFVDSVKDLGVLIDNTLSLNSQINDVARISSYHLRNIAFIRKYIDEESTKKLVCNCVINRLDYCNSIYYNLPNYQLRKLQRIQSKAARLIKGVRRQDRITPVLIELHWLPIKARIKYKICVLTQQAIVTGKPGYLRNMLSIKQLTSHRGVDTRSYTDGRKLVEPRCYSNMGFRAFRSIAPRLYNTLPREVRLLDNIATFKKKLKTTIFDDCYNLEDRSIKMDYII